MRILARVPAALLAGVVLWSLLFGAVPPQWAAAGGAAACLLWLIAGHSHCTVEEMERLAGTSRFQQVHPGVRIWGAAGLLVLCLLASTPWTPLTLFAVMAVLTCEGGRRLHAYLSALTVPLLFLLVSALALLWEYSSQAQGLVRLPFCGGYWILHPAAQQAARLVVARALGAVGCLYFIGFTTRISEFLSVLRAVHMPEAVLDLAVLIYRYIFLLLKTFETMRAAAASRLGFGSLRRDLRTTGILYGNLLAYSFRRAQESFNAMESRCAGGKIIFLTNEKQVRGCHLLGFGILWAGMLAALALGG